MPFVNTSHSALSYKAIAVGFASLVALAGCGAPEEPGNEGDTGTSEAEIKVPFSVIAGDIGSAGTVETRRAIKSEKDYTSFFGHTPPASVDFNRDWVIFYSAGTRSTGGYAASIASITFTTSGKTMKITTALESPGPRCIVNQLVTRPAVLVKIAAPATTPSYVRYEQSDTTRDCGGVCIDNVACIKGTQWSHADCKCMPIPQCKVDADRRIFSDYCTGCNCRVLGAHDADPTCGGPGVRCIADPCTGHAAACVTGACVLK